MASLEDFPPDGIYCQQCNRRYTQFICRLKQSEGFREYSCPLHGQLLCKTPELVKVPIPEGVSDFGTLRLNKPPLPFVDKTLMIKEICDKGFSAIIIIRPRRFGKSLNISMLSHFFWILKKDDFCKVFEETNIFKEKDIVESHANKYPVIHLNFGAFAGILSDSKEAFLKYLQKLLFKAKRDNNKLLTNISAEDRGILDTLVTTNDPAIITDGLKTLSEILSRACNDQKCLILLDEYDAPITEVFQNKARMDVLSDVFSKFLISGLKDNEFLFKGIVTGCTKISGEKIFSGLNSVTLYSLLDNRFQMGYGFSEDEVVSLIKKWRCISEDRIENVMKRVREFYNGYQVSYKGIKINIYNPNSIMKYLQEGEIEPYWVDTGEYNFLNYSHNEFPNKALEVAEALQKGVFEDQIDKAMSIVDILRDPDNIWTLLFFAGYITRDLDTPPNTPGHLSLKVPNEEIRRGYSKMSTRFALLMSVSFQNRIRTALQQFNLSNLFQEINRWITSAEISGHAYSDETAYRATVRTLIRIIADQEWDIIEEVIQTDNSNNRSDLIVVPKKNMFIKKAYIFEFKFLAKEKNNQEALNEKQTEAYKQILEKQYWKLIQNRNTEYEIDEVLGVGAVGCALKLSYTSSLISQYVKNPVRPVAGTS